jgi:hypothetical protein
MPHSQSEGRSTAGGLHGGTGGGSQIDLIFSVIDALDGS